MIMSAICVSQIFSIFDHKINDAKLNKRVKVNATTLANIIYVNLSIYIVVQLLTTIDKTITRL